MSVSLFGVGLKTGGRFGTQITRRLLPQLPLMQAQCAALLFLAKLAVASFVCSIGAILLLTVPEYTAHLDDSAGVADIYLPLVFLFYFAYITAGPCFSVVDAALSVATQNWCLDYKQNCQDLEGEPWMLALHDAEDLEEMHAFFTEQLLAREKAKKKSASEATVRQTRVPKLEAQGAGGVEAAEEGRADKGDERKRSKERAGGSKERTKEGKAGAKSKCTN